MKKKKRLLTQKCCCCVHRCSKRVEKIIAAYRTQSFKKYLTKYYCKIMSYSTLTREIPANFLEYFTCITQK